MGAEGVLVSVGYEGRSVDDLVAVLVEHDVDVLVDVRLTPLSRKPGLSKRRLAETLAAHGIQYRHLPALGNPKDNRDGFRAGDPLSLRRFTDCLTSADGDQAVGHVAELLDGQVVALLCFERDHGTCHRHLVARQVQLRRPGVELTAV